MIAPPKKQPFESWEAYERRYRRWEGREPLWAVGFWLMYGALIAASVFACWRVS